MGNAYVGNAATFLIETLFGLYILIVMLRFLLQLLRADFYNPISQFIVKATQPLLKPMRRMIPGWAGLDLSSVVLMAVLQYAQLWLVTAVLGYSAAVSGLALLTLAELLKLLIHVFLFAILIQVIISWVNPGAYNPVTSVLHTLTEPLLGPARRIIPPLGGLDISPIFALIALQLASILLVSPIRDMARGML